MDFKNYKAGNFRQQRRYQCFIPTEINTGWTWSDPKINTLLAEANRKLGEFNAYSLGVPDVDYFISMHVIKEATTSSRIEGTQTNIGEALLKRNDVEPEKRDDWQEVQNYIRAMNNAIAKLEKLPLSTRLLKETHRTLLSKGRGASKLPGEYRRSQNWIGGVTINDATFVPPPYEEVDRFMGDLENFLHNETIEVPHLIRIAIAHYQFETIHPFLDGNGRLGRLMITLYLVGDGLLAEPTLYLSDYFDKNRGLYYDNLSRIRTSNDLGQWIKFFLSAIIDTSTKGIETFDRILRLRKDVEDKRLPTIGKRLSKAKALLKALYSNPSVTPTDVEKLLDVAPASANRLIQDLVSLNILREVTGGKRNRRFVFWEYMQLFE